ncbi:hypothetical protein LXL04_010435 [Taraxacum kok-saghyz]
MSLPHTKSEKPCCSDDLTISEMKTQDQIKGQKIGSKSSALARRKKSTPKKIEKDEKVKVKKQKNVVVEPKPKFTISLSPREIEDDLYALTGKRHLRSKKKRDKKTKEGLDVGFPGSSLDHHDVESLRKKYESLF